MSRRFSWFYVSLFSFSLLGAQVFAEDNSGKSTDAKKNTVAKADVKAKKSKVKESRIKEDGDEVELFEAIDKGLVSADIIPKDATEATIQFRNKTDKPLRLKLPATFGAVPVLAQGGMGMGAGAMGGGGMGGGGMGGGGMGGGGMGGGQGMGGGMGGGGMGGMGGGGMGGMGGGGMGGMGGGGMGGMGGGMFRVEPNQPRKMKVAAVCLEHGKRDPSPRMKYKLVRLEEVNADPHVAQVCAGLGSGQLSQNTAQAIAWHYTDNMSWEELSQKPRVVSEYTGIEYWFSSFEIQDAMKIANYVESVVEKSSQSTKHSSGGTGK